MKVLFLSNLYPNPQEPARGTFNRQKISNLKKLCEITVIAPISLSWVFFKPMHVKHKAQIPEREKIDGVDVYHPRVLYIPKFFKLSHGMFYYLCVRRLVKRLHKNHGFDLIYSSWIYPDGFGAQKLSRLLGIPFIAEARGSDINLVSSAHLPAYTKMIREILEQSEKVITVSKALKKKIAEFEIPEEKILHIYNGVNPDLFYIMDKAEARRKLGLSLSGRLVIFVGHLIRVKGVQFLMQAVKRSKNKDWKLIIIGNGCLEKSLFLERKTLNLEDRVSLVDTCPHNEIPLWMNAADLLCLPSLSEGTPNVVLEAFSCGLPVAANPVGGVPEIVSEEGLGILSDEISPEGLAGCIDRALEKSWDRERISIYAKKFSWEENARKIYEVFSGVVEKNKSINNKGKSVD